MTEMINKLSTMFLSEIDGVKKYADFSIELDEYNKKFEAAIFRDMAWEEYTHAKHIKMLIHDIAKGEPPANHADMVKKWQDVNVSLEKLRAKK